MDINLSYIKREKTKGSHYIPWQHEQFGSIYIMTILNNT